MRRAVLWREGEIRIEEVPDPRPGPGEVVIRNRVSTTCGTDVKSYLRGYPLLKPPHPFGHEFSGVIDSVGAGVDGWSPGDRVAVHNSAPCGRCYWCKHSQFSLCENIVFNRGAYAELVRVPRQIVRQNMFLMPAEMTHGIASLLEPLSCAVYGIECCPIESGDLVVVNGAGPMGLMFCRLAMRRGARVIAVDPNARRLAVAERMGAWRTVAPESARAAVEEVRDLTDDRRGADAVIEATGLIEVWEASCHIVRKGGFALLFGGAKQGSELTIDATLLHYRQLTVAGVFHTTPLAVSRAFSLLEMGAVSEKDFIQHKHRLDDVEAAILEHAAGSVIKTCIVYD